MLWQLYISARIGWSLVDRLDERTTLIPVITVCMPCADYRSMVRNVPGHMTRALLHNLFSLPSINYSFEALTSNFPSGYHRVLIWMPGLSPYTPLSPDDDEARRFNVGNQTVTLVNEMSRWLGCQILHFLILTITITQWYYSAITPMKSYHWVQFSCSGNTELDPSIDSGQ